MYQGYGARDVVVAGDSAGGNLALVLTHLLKEAGRRLPRALILLSPWTDMTASGKSYQERAAIDPVLTVNYIHAVRDAYARGPGLVRLPALPPVSGDLKDFPPTLIQAGSSELLLSDSIRLRDRLVQAAVPCRLEVWDGSLACIPDVPHEKGHRGHGEHRAFPFGDTIKETRFFAMAILVTGGAPGISAATAWPPLIERGADVVVVGRPVQGPPGGPQGRPPLCGQRSRPGLPGRCILQGAHRGGHPLRRLLPGGSRVCRCPNSIFRNNVTAG